MIIFAYHFNQQQNKAWLMHTKSHYFLIDAGNHFNMFQNRKENENGEFFSTFFI
jgi:hypothetical protein